MNDLKEWAVYTVQYPKEDDPEGEFEALPLDEAKGLNDKIVSHGDLRWLRHYDGQRWTGSEARIVSAVTETEAIDKVRKHLTRF